MRALTVKQPWASLIASGIKRVENRTYPVPKTVRGQRVAIHAGKGFDGSWREKYPCSCGNQVAFGADFSEVGYLCQACEVIAIDLISGNRLRHSSSLAGRIICTARIVGQVRLRPIQFAGKKPEKELLWWGEKPWNGRTPTLKEQLEFNRVYWSDPFWQRDCYGWVLADVELVDDPRIHRGMLGFWEVKSGVLA